MKKLLAFFLLFCFFFLFPQKMHASDFLISGNATYTVQTSGMTHVEYDLTLTNATSQYFASSYTLHTGVKNVQNLVASEKNVRMTPKISQANGNAVVTVSFPQHVLGKNAVLPFIIAFDTPNIASLNGSLWEINIPGLTNTAHFSDFSVHVVVPSYFSEPLYIKPATTSADLVFTKEQLGTGGISIAYGDKQVYTFNLQYTIQNTGFTQQTQDIALPPDTSYQEVSLAHINPKPQNVTTDIDGNWLAQYQLNPGETKEITVSGKVFLALTPKQEQLTQEQFAQYTRQQPFWQSADPNIVSLAQKLRTIAAIYEYVVSHLSYDFARVSTNQQRLGALGVLGKKTQAVCLEFTDLFIAISRAGGIPSREIDGYAYTQNTSQRPLLSGEEILHAWPEYYDMQAKKWIMVDPTWQNTTGGVDYFHTFDLDHIAFVIHGASSTMPLPAGAYTLPGQPSGSTIRIGFAPESVTPNPTAQFSLAGASQSTAGFPMIVHLVIKNTGSVLFPTQKVIVQTALGRGDQTITTPVVPPFGTASIAIPLPPTGFLTSAKDMVTIRVAGQTLTKVISVTPLSFIFIVLAGGGIIAVFAYIISIIARKPRHLSIF